MKIFGTVFPFVESNDHDYRMGRFIANYEFLTALLQHSQFDQFHLFCMNPQHMQSTAERLTQDNSISSTAKARIQLFLYSSLREKLETETYHIFHLGGWGYFFSGMAQLRSRYARQPFPIIGVIHSLNARDARFDYYKLLRAPLGACDAVICTSEAGRLVVDKQLERIADLEGCAGFQGQLPVIPLGIDDCALPDRVQSRRTLGIQEGTTALLYLGRLSPNTKADLYPLLLCFKSLCEHSSTALKLILAGGAGATELRLHQEMIRELGLENSVLLLANFDPSLKPQLYAAADISVAPSDNLQETFGLSIIESMQAGLPVVASDLNGYRDLIDDGVNGYLIHTTWIDQLQLAEMDEIMSGDTLQTLLAQSMVVDPEQLRDRLQALIDNEELRRQMGDSGRHKVQQNYLWPVVIDRYEALWDDLQKKALNCTFQTAPSGMFSNDFLGGFSHYASTTLNDTMQVSLTDAGRTSLSTGNTPPIYSDVAMLLDQKWLSAAFTRLQQSGEEIAAGELLAELGDGDNRGRFSLLWAAKYGLVRLR